MPGIMKKLSFILLSTFICISCYCQSPDSINSKQDISNTIFTKVEIEARPGGEKNSWEEFLHKNINYDIAAFNEAPTGKYIVKVKFTVFKDGHLGDFIPLTKFGYGMEREVVHALKKSPDWKPAFQNGKAVDAYRIQTVTFVVERL